MKTLPEYRTDDEIEIIVRGMQALDEFTYYQPEVQRKMARYLFYEEYEANRIIFKEGNLADFMYFVVKGACKFVLRMSVGLKFFHRKNSNFSNSFSEHFVKILRLRNSLHAQNLPVGL